MKGEIIPIRETKIIYGKKFVHKYSINGMKIECGGVPYDDAWDLEYLNREYTETDIPVEAELIDPEEGVVNNDE